MFGFLNGIRKCKEEVKFLKSQLKSVSENQFNDIQFLHKRLNGFSERIIKNESGLIDITKKLFTKQVPEGFKATSAKDTLKISKAEITESVNFLSKLCHDLASEAGWNDVQREIGTDLMLIVSEVAEAMEGARKDLYDDHLPHRKMLDVELADALIRIMHTAFKSTPELGEIVYDKLVYNTKREDHKKENRERKGGKLF